MNKELQQYYEARFELFSTKGWKDLIEDIDVMIESIDRIDPITTVEQLHFKKGELSILKWLIGLRDSSIQSYEELKSESPE